MNDCTSSNDDIGLATEGSLAWQWVALWTGWGLVIGGLVAWLDRSLFCGLLWMALGVAIAALPSPLCKLLDLVAAMNQPWGEYLVNRIDPRDEFSGAYKINYEHAAEIVEMESNIAGFHEKPLADDAREALIRNYILQSGRQEIDLIAMPLPVGIAAGTLFGPLCGVSARLDYDGPAWLYGLIGWAVAIPLLAQLTAFVMFYLAHRQPQPYGISRRLRWLSLLWPLWFISGLFYGLKHWILPNPCDPFPRGS